MPAPADRSVSEATPHVRVADYLIVAAILTLYSLGLAYITQTAGTRTPSPERLLAPMEALFGLTAFVWLLMVGVRNGTILFGITKANYYRDYQSDHPPEWVERPARTFNNLLQAPVLFYVICLMMMLTGRVDEAQLALAWVYVAGRVVHATIYMGWNYVPYRFAAWIASCIALGVLWFRFIF